MWLTLRVRASHRCSCQVFRETVEETQFVTTAVVPSILAIAAGSQATPKALVEFGQLSGRLVSRQEQERKAALWAVCQGDLMSSPHSVWSGPGHLSTKVRCAQAFQAASSLATRSGCCSARSFCSVRSASMSKSCHGCR